MLDPDLLYGVTDYDVRVGTAPVRWKSGAIRTITNNPDVIELPFFEGGTVLSQYVVPPNKVLHIRSAWLSGRITAGSDLWESIVWYRARNLLTFDSFGSLKVARWPPASGPGNTTESTIEYPWRIDDITLFPGEFLALQCIKTGAVGSFNLNLYAWGWILPRGNLQP